MKLFYRIIISISVAAYNYPVSSLSVSKELNEENFYVSKSSEEIHVHDNFPESFHDEEDIPFIEMLTVLYRNSYHLLLSNNNALNISEKCMDDLKYIFQTISSPNGFAARMIDSYGKPEAGILQGNVNWLGDFDGCLGIRVPPNPNDTSTGDFRGQYCKLAVSLNLKNQTIPLEIGTCQPDSCSSADLKILLEHQLDRNISVPLPMLKVTIDLKEIFTKVNFFCQPLDVPLTTGAKVVIFIISIFVTLAVIGSSFTVYEFIFKEQATENANTDIHLAESNAKDSDEPTPDSKLEIVDVNAADKKPEDGKIFKPDVVDPSAADKKPGFEKLFKWIQRSKPFFNCFCVFTNGAKLLDMSSSEGQLPCLHGIRFLSLSWVISGHAFSFAIGSIRIGGHAIELLDKFSFQIISNGFYSVDSFFLLSGFLLAYLYFKQVSKPNGSVPWVYFYVHRYFRLTPVYLMAILVYTNLMYYMGSGPNWFSMTTEPVCSKYWWENLLYINNFEPTEKQCMGWSWYLSNDMQFFAVSPLLLITLWRWPKIGYAVMGLFFAASFISNFVVTYHFNLISGLGGLTHSRNIMEFMKRYTEFMNKIYVRPYTRISAYLVGICLAYYLHKRKQSNSGKNNLWILSGGWILSTTISLICLFGLYHRDMSSIEYSFYNAFHRTCFACGLAWVMYVCLTEQGGVVNDILSCKLFIPLSRLTYCAYLFHPIIMLSIYKSGRSMIDFTEITMVMLILGFLFLSYVTAFFTSLLFESPILRLEKFVRNIKFK